MKRSRIAFLAYNQNASVNSTFIKYVNKNARNNLSLGNTRFEFCLKFASKNTNLNIKKISFLKITTILNLGSTFKRNSCFFK